LKNKAKIEVDEKLLKDVTALPPDPHQGAIRRGHEKRKAGPGGFRRQFLHACRQLRPILKELEKEYAEKARILVIDVYKYQDLAKEYRVQLIPP